MLGSSHIRHETPTAPAPYLTPAVVQRNVTSGGRDIPVCGPGSRASFGFCADGYVRSLSYQWKGTAHTGNLVKPSSVDRIYKSIVQQLKPSTETGPVTVDGVDVCFYDSGLDRPSTMAKSVVSPRPGI
jgi:hypothetical protein